MTIWQAIRASYREAGIFLFACPLLALIPIAVEMIQHVVEMQIGMYDNLEMAKQTEKHPFRMGFGMVKVLALILPIYWITRFIGFDRSAQLAGKWDRIAVRLFAPLLLLQIVLAVLQLFIIPQNMRWMLGALVGGQVLGALIAAWAVAAPLGNAAIGPLESTRLMARHVLATILIFIAAMLPLMIPHYLLAAAAIFGPDWSKWPILIMDSLLVGWLSAVMVASGYFAAKRAADKAGIDLKGAI